jgi:DNA-directed RNA polymerase specialized sigma24 family protein
MSSPAARTSPREEQSAVLRSKEGELGRLADLQKREEFFQQILPLLEPLKDYVKRRLRIAYLDMDVRTPVETTGDILDRVILKAYADFRKKPADLSLEQWLYQLTDWALQSYIQRRKRIDARRRSLETLTKAELRSLEEQITADADAEPWLVEASTTPKLSSANLDRLPTPRAIRRRNWSVKRKWTWSYVLSPKFPSATARFSIW